MTYTYVLNRNSKTLHLKVDGMSREDCNLDQLKNSVESKLPPKDGKWYRCTKCMVNAPIGPVA